MGCFYEMSGSVVCRNVPEVAAIVDQFNAAAGAITASIEIHDSRVTCAVEFAGGDNMPYALANELDGIAEKLGPFTLVPTTIHTRCDDESGWYYIGSPEMAEFVDSQRRHDRAATYLHSALVPDHASALIEILIPMLDEPGRIALLAKLI